MPTLKNHKQTGLLLFLLASFGFCDKLSAEIISSSESHYNLSHTATSQMTQSQVWARLINPSEWWHPDHTYSGSAENLSLDLRAGGLWREDWKDGSVLHGQVLTFQRDKTLRLDAPFGPLQSMAVNVVWTISLQPSEQGGTKITFSEIANGDIKSNLNEIAPAVDFVKQQAIERLANKK